MVSAFFSRFGTSGVAATTKAGERQQPFRLARWLVLSAVIVATAVCAGLAPLLVVALQLFFQR